MRNRLMILLTLILVVAGCKKSEITGLEATNGLELGVVLHGDGSAAAKAATASPLAVGYRFRLYIFPKGETDPSKATTTRTYTITDIAGTPAMDAGQDAILLAKGFYDTYIVGPLMGVDKAGAAVEVASASGVNVHVGNDLVSSYKELSVVAASNVLTPNPLAHKMAKAEFIMEQPKDAVYTDLKVLTISVDKQPVGGSFAFEPQSGGLVSVGTALETRVYTPKDVSLVTTPKTKYLAVDYLFTQPSKELKIETTFNSTITKDGVAEEKRYNQSGLITTDIVAAQQYEFSAAPITPKYLLWRIKLVPWNDTVAGVVGVHDRDLILSYSSFDAPVTIDGKKYWLDRSGNGHHALMGNYVGYNADEKYYYITHRDTKTFIVPPLGDMQDVTVEIVAKTNYNSYNALITGSGLTVSAPREAGNVELAWGSQTNTLDKTLVESLSYGSFLVSSTWQFTRTVQASDVRSEILRDGVSLKTNTTRSNTIAFNNLSLLPWKCDGTKLYAVRMYRKVLTAAELAVNAASDAQRHLQPGIDPSGPGGVVPKDGGRYSVHVSAAGPWTVTTSAGVTAAPTSGTGPTNVTLTVEANTLATVTRNLEAIFTISGMHYKWIGQQMRGDMVYVGRFAGTMKEVVVGSETHWYYDKQLFASAADEAGTYQYTNDVNNVVTSANSIIDGAKNTTLMNNARWAAAWACRTKAGGDWFLPAQRQLIGLRIARTLTPNLYWSSSFASARNSWHMFSAGGAVMNSHDQQLVSMNVRCVQEF